MERKLASLQVVKAVEAIPNADKLELAKILGWQCVVSKDEFKEGDFGVYFEVDSILPEIPEFEFLAKRNYRIKTMKLRGVVSQGLLIPLSLAKQIVDRLHATGKLPEYYQPDMTEGSDWTQAMGVFKYEPLIPECLKGKIMGDFPTYLVPKTDEERIQSNPRLLDEFQGKMVYITSKMDGTSGTTAWDGEKLHVCSRNKELAETGDNAYWKVVKKYKLDEILKKCGRKLALQYEICGPGIQKNPAGLEDLEIFVYSIFDIEAHKYWSYHEVRTFCTLYGLQLVPLQTVTRFDWKTVEDIEKLCEGSYPNGHRREGIVIRPVDEMYSGVLAGRLSMKCVDKAYLLKTEE